MTVVAAAGTKRMVGKDDVAEVEPTCRNWQVAGRSLAAMRYTTGGEGGNGKGKGQVYMVCLPFFSFLI